MKRPNSKSDPRALFQSWLKEASLQEPSWPEAVALATVDAQGQPSLRMVLFKGVNQEGFRFFTNYQSRKGRELSKNPHVALLFYWKSLNRQIRIEGRIEKLTREESIEYFHSRLRESQINAVISPQSQKIKSRKELLEEVRRVSKLYEGKEIPCPLHWGGYLVKPESFEFWIADPFRLHDRFVYKKVGARYQFSQIAP